MEETETVVSSSCGRKESRIKKMRTLKDTHHKGNQGGSDSKMVAAGDHLPQGKKIREAPVSTAMMSDATFLWSVTATGREACENTVNAELTQEKRQVDFCIGAKNSGSKNACDGLSDKKSKMANKRKVDGMYETNRVRNAKTVTEDARELVGHWSSCHKSKKSAVHPVVKETGHESQPPEATLVDEVTHRFSRINTGGTSECGRRLVDYDLNELLTELKAFKDKAQEADPDEPGLVLIKFV